MMLRRERDPAWTWPAVGILLLASLIHGLYMTRGLASPAIMDTFRDAGFARGIMDGNWFGDPSIAGAARYYPPLFHALFAALATVLHTQPVRLMVGIAPYANLALPLGFFLMARSLVGAPGAVFGTALLVGFNGILLAPWVSAAYQPWASIPMLALAAFFFSLWLIRAKVQSEKLIDAVWIGTALGLTFLAHTVPAVLLAAILPAAVWATRGFRWRSLLWLTLAAAVALAWSLVLLGPLYFSYHLHIVNGGPGGYTDPLFAYWPPGNGVLLGVLPGMLALPLLVGLGMGSGPARTRASLAMLAVWLAVAALFLARHYTCGDSPAGACTVFRVAVHHWYIYLQAGATCIGGLAGWRAVERILAWSQRPRLVATAGCAALALFAASAFWVRHAESMMQLRSTQLAAVFDWQLYDWAAHHSNVGDVFVTELPEESSNPASLAVMAAGRTSVALPQTYSNPYVDWETRDRRNSLYLAAARSSAARDKGSLCSLLIGAKDGVPAYVILTNPAPVLSPALHPVYAGTHSTVYRTVPGSCVARATATTPD